MAPRKTIPVAEVKDRANDILQMSTAESINVRHGVIGLIERILMDTDNYKGFQYLDSEFVGTGTDRVLREGYDHTRRRYF